MVMRKPDRETDLVVAAIVLTVVGISVYRRYSWPDERIGRKSDQATEKRQDRQ